MAKTPNSYGSFRLWPAILVGASCLQPPDARSNFFRVSYYIRARCLCLGVAKHAGRHKRKSFVLPKNKEQILRKLPKNNCHDV